MKKIIILLGLLVSACNKDEPPAPSAEQTARLDEAEDMLNSMAANEEGPEANASDPSTNSN
jgi:hypothetical protein